MHVIHVVPTVSAVSAVSIRYIVPVMHFRSSGRRSARMNLVKCIRAYRSSWGRCRTSVIIITQ